MVQVLLLDEEAREARLAAQPQPLVELCAAQVEIEDHRLLARGGEQLGQVDEGGGLALLGGGPGDEHDLARLLLAREEQGRAQVLVGLGHEVDAGFVVARDGGQEVDVEVALELLGVPDGGVEVVAPEREEDAQDEPHHQARARGVGLVGPHR